MTETARSIGLALVRMPVAPVHGEPRVSSAQTTQTLFGRAVAVLEHLGEWRRVRTMPDGYEGFIHAGYLTAIEGPTFAEALEAAGEPAGARVSLGCTVRAGGRTLRLPLGAWIGADVDVLDGEAVAMGELPTRFPADGGAVVRTAGRYFGSTSYQWGGVTPWGADCSGLVQTVFALHGVELPRDAAQQAAAGADAGGALDAHAAGDLLFFSEREDGRVTHVGIAGGGGRMLHLGLGRGGFADEDLAGDDAPYVAALRARLVAARRVLG